MAVFNIPYEKVSLTANGDPTGLLTVSTTVNLVEKAIVFLRSDTQPIKQLMIDKIISGTQLYVKEISGYIYNRYNVSAFLVLDNATLTQPLSTLDDYISALQQVSVLESGVPVGLANTLNFLGGASVSIAGNKANIIVTGGTSSTYTVVNTYNDLPITLGVPAIDTIYVVKQSTGVWLINRKERGLWIRTSNAGALTDWVRLGDWLEAFNDSNFAIYNNLDNSKQIEFDLGGISSSTVRTYLAPNKNGTLALLSDILSTVKKNGTVVGSRSAINFIEGTNVTLTVTDDSVNNEIDVVINAAGGGGGGGINISAGTQTATSGTVVFSNSNGISFGMSNSSVITASYTVPTQSNQTIGGYAVGNTTGQSSSSTFDARSLSLQGAGIVSLGYSNSSLLISATSAAQTVQTQNVVVPSAGTQTATSGTVVFSNSNGVSFGMSGSSRITGSFDAIKSVSAGTTRLTNGEAVFSDSNGISFGVNGNTITASHNGLTSQSNQALSGSNGSFNFQTATFGNLNGLSFYTSNGSMVGSYTVPAVPAQTNQTIGGYAVGNTTGQSSSSTFDARTLSLNGAGIVSVGYSNGSVLVSATTANQTVQTQNVVVPSAGTQTATSGTVVFSNSNGISFGMSNSSVITASYTVPTQSNQTLGSYAVGNTTGQSSSSTFDARTASISGAGIVSVGYSAGNIIISASAAGAADGVNIIAAGTQTANTTGTVVFSNANNVSFGMSNSSVVTASASYSQSTAPAAISAGTTQATNGTVVFSNSNGISFGLNGNTVTASYTVPTQSNQTIGGYAVGNTTGQSSSSTFDARTLSLNGAGNVSVGYSGGSIVISGTQTVQTQNVVVPSAGTQTATSGTVVWSNSNGISFGMSGSSRITGSFDAVKSVSAGTTRLTNGEAVFSDSNGISFGVNGNTITASHNGLTSQSNQALSGSNGSFNFQTATFGNLNGLSFYTSNGSMVGSYTVPTQTVQTLGSYAVGNTTGQSSSTTFDARTASISGAGIVSVGYSAGNLIISASAAGAADGVNIIAAGTQTANTTGTVVFSNANNITFGMSNSSVVTASASYSQSTAPAAISAGTTQATSGTVVFSNSNGISFGLNGNTVTASYTVPTQSNQTLGYYALGNTTGQSSSSTFDARTISISGLGNISVGYSGSNIIISGAGGGGIANAAGTQTATSGTVVFSNSNGISFGMSNSSVITASYTVPTQTVQTLGLYASGNTTGQSSSSTFDARSVSISGMGGVNVGYSSSQIIVSGVQTDLVAGPNITLSPSGSTISISADPPIYIAAGTQTASSNTVVFSNSNSITFGMSGSSRITASFSVDAIRSISAGTTRLTNGEAVFSNSNGISFGVNGNTITASHNGLTSQSNQALSGSNGSFNFQTATFGNLNGLSFYTSNGSMVGSYTQSTSPSALAAGTQTATSGTVVFSNSNGISFGMSNSSVITASYTVPTGLTVFATGNTTQSSTGTFNQSSLLFNGAGIASVGVTNGSVVISVPAGGGGGDGVNIVQAGTTGTTGTTYSTLSGTIRINGTNNIVVSQNGSNDINIGDATQRFLINQNPASTASQTKGVMNATSASAFFFPVNVPVPLEFNILYLVENFSYATSTISGAQTLSSTVGIYSNNASTLSLISSNSFSIAITNSSVSATISYPVSTATTGYSYGTTSGSTTALLQSLVGTAAGGRLIGIQFGNTMALTPGEYFIGNIRRGSSSNANIGISEAFNGNAVPSFVNVAGIGQISTAITTNFTFRPYDGLGPYTSTGSAGYGGTALPSSVFLSGIAHTMTIMPLAVFSST